MCRYNLFNFVTLQCNYQFNFDIERSARIRDSAGESGYLQECLRDDSKSLIGVDYESNPDPGDSGPGNNCGRVELDPSARLPVSAPVIKTTGLLMDSRAGRHPLPAIAPPQVKRSIEGSRPRRRPHGSGRRDRRLVPARIRSRGRLGRQPSRTTSISASAIGISLLAFFAPRHQDEC